MADGAVGVFLDTDALGLELEAQRVDSFLKLIHDDVSFAIVDRKKTAVISRRETHISHRYRKADILDMTAVRGLLCKGTKNARKNFRANNRGSPVTTNVNVNFALQIYRQFRYLQNFPP